MRKTYYLREEPDVKTLGTSLFVNANHVFGRGFVVVFEFHDDEPMVVIAALEENGIGTNLIGDVVLPLRGSKR